MNFSGHLARRISLILGGSLVLAALGSIGTLRYLQGGDLRQKPMSEQLAAAAELVEGSSPEQLTLVLRALNSMDQKVSLAEQPPAGGGMLLPGVSLGVERYFSKHGLPRPVRAESYREPGGGNAVRLVVGLRDGRSLVVERRDEVVGYLLGMRMVTAGLFAIIVVGGLALWLLRSQLRPLENVVHAVETFGDRLDCEPLPPHRGASEIRRLVDAFNGMQLRIRRLVEGRTRMVAAIGHDLGTYLTRLRLRVEYIQDPKQRERAIHDIDEMNALMRDTLTLAGQELNAEAGQEVDIGRMAERQVESFASSGADVRLVETNQAVVRGQPGALARVFGNLIGNALRYAGAAEVSVRRAGGGVELRIEDRGPGIPAALRELVLEPFYRADSARNLDAGGFGLGLAIVSEIVRRQRATLALDDRPGGGLSVRVVFPAAA